MSLAGIERIKEDQLEVKKCIGRGGFGVVLLCNHKDLLEDVAIKCIQNVSQDEIERLVQEATTMFRIRHEFIIGFYGLTIIPEKGLYGLVMPYMKNGSLQDICEKINVPWALRLRMIYELAAGVNYLHSLSPKILHMDLKSPNVLLDEDFKVKVTDFGLSKWRTMNTAADLRGSLEGGTVTHMPPEYLESLSTEPTEKFDIYSYGIVVWEVLTGRQPYEGATSVAQLAVLVVGGNRPALKLIPDDAPDYIQNVVMPLMVDCWDKDPTKRPTFRECLMRMKDTMEESKDQARADTDKVRVAQSRISEMEGVMRGIGLLAFLMDGLEGLSVSRAAAETARTLPPGATTRMTTLDQSDVEDRVLGTIYGQCIGNAIGLLTTYMSPADCKKNYGRIPQLEYSHCVEHASTKQYRKGDWTADTDQMLLIMDSIMDRKGKLDAVDFAKKLANWAKNGYRELGDTCGTVGKSVLMCLKDKTFTQDPHLVSKDYWEKTGRVNASNGALMRTSILGVYQFRQIATVVENTLSICKTTNPDPKCQAAAIAVTTAIALMLQRAPIHINKATGGYDLQKIMQAAFDYAKEFLTDSEARKEMRQKMCADTLAELQLSNQKTEGYVFTALGAGFWALRQDDFRTAIQEIIMQGGDADTNGAVAGALLGCKVGVKALPRTWINGLIHRDWLEKRIQKFMTLMYPERKK